MLSESLIIGLIVLLLCGAVSFYMYIRLSYLEKKTSVMESILVDMRVALDSIIMENTVHPTPAPIAHTPGVHFSAPVPVDASEAEEVPEDKFYSSILEQAHSAAEQSSDLSGQDLSGSITADAALESFDSPSLAMPAVVIESAPPSTTLNLDTMTRNELSALAEKRGIRVKRNMNRGEVLSLLRRMENAQNASVTTGTENVSEPTGGNIQGGASLDGDVSANLGNSGSSLE